MMRLSIILICLSSWLIFSSFSPQTFWFEIKGTVKFENQAKGSTEGLVIQLYGDGSLLSESKVNDKFEFQLGFLDLHYNKLALYYKEPGTRSFIIMEISFDMFTDQMLYLELNI